jgi:predicted heme/steroid binding protein
MTEPLTVQIGPIPFTIVDEPVAELAESTWLGCCNHAKGTITLRDDLSPQIRRSTLWHESIHAILHQAGQNGVDESVVESVANGVMQLLQDNPWFGENDSAS